MEKLTQFVSKSFENNNNRVTRPTVQNILNLKLDKNDDDGINDKVTNQDSSDAKTEDVQEEVTTKPPKPAKNWLISNSPKPQNICTSYGMDLRVNPNGYPLIFGSATQPICDIPQYSEQKCDGDDKDKIKWFKDIKQPSSPRNCCCSTINDQDDSVESNYDSIARMKIQSDNNSTFGIEDKNPGKLYFKRYLINCS